MKDGFEVNPPGGLIRAWTRGSCGSLGRDPAVKMSSMEEMMERVCERVQARGLNPLFQRRGAGECQLRGGAAAGTGEVQPAGGQGQAEPAEPLPTRARREALHGGCGLEAAARGHGGFSPASPSVFAPRP